MQGLTAAQATGSRVVTCAVYLRVSTVDQGRRGFSIPEQRKACQAKAQALARAEERNTGEAVSLELFEFVDTAGGDLLERPELDRLRRFVRELHPAFVVCLDPDRLSRAAYQAILVANEIEAAGTRLEFVQHDYQTTSEGRLFFTLRVAIAEYEKAKILERTARGKRGKLAAGEIPHHIRAYGYNRISLAERQLRHRAGHPDPGPLAVDATEAAWVRQMFEWVVKDQLGSQAIAERLNQIGVPAKEGGPWRRGVVARMLRSTTYIGQLALNRFDCRGLGAQQQLPKERRTKMITARERPESEWVVVKVPAIITEDLYNEAQSVLDNMKRRSGTRIHPGRRGHLLSGILTCGLCGGPMYYVWNNRINGYLSRCANRYPELRNMKVPPPPCPHPHQKMLQFEQYTWNKVKSWFTDPDLLREELRRSALEPEANRQELAERLRTLNAQVEEGKRRQSRVLYLVTKGVVHPAVAEGQLSEIKDHLDALEREVRSLESRLAQSSTRVRTVDQVVRRVEAIRAEVLATLDDMTLEEGQTLVRMVAREVRVFPGGRCEVVPAEGGSATGTVT